MSCLHALLLLAAGPAAAGPEAAQPPPAEAPEAAPSLQEAMRRILEESAAAVTPGQLERAAVEGMLAWLDGETGGGNALLTDEEWRQWEARREGRYQGIGIQFIVVPRQGVLVTRVYPGSPADRAGLREGMAIPQIGDVPFAGKGPAELHRAMLENDDDPVRLVVLDEDQQRRVVAIRRGPFRIEPVALVDPGPPALVRVDAFSRGAASALSRALAGVSGDVVVLDLRDNRGGLLDEAVDAADLFLDPGTRIGSTWRRGGDEEPLVARRPRAWSGQAILLVNRGTAGEAELFAAALHAQLQAPLVGTPTAGAGRATRVIDLASGHHLLLASAIYLDPSGRPLQGGGLRPAQYVDGTAPAMVAPWTPPPDLQLEAALQLASTPAR